MKNTFLLLALLFSSLMFAQNDDDTSNSSAQPTSEKQRRNEVSLEFLGMIDGRFVPAYERSFGKHWSAKVGIGYKVKEGLVNFSGINGEKLKTGDINYDGGVFYGEGRYYVNAFNNGRAVGFYFGLYIKYSGFQSDIGGTYITDEGENFNFLFDTNIGVTSSGFQLGYKLPIGKRFAVDFLIAGPGTARYSFDIKNRSDPLPDEFFDDLNDLLEEYGFFELIDTDFDFQPSDSSSAFNTVNFRYAISFSFNF